MLEIPLNDLLALFGSFVVVAVCLAGIGKGVNSIIFPQGLDFEYRRLSWFRRAWKKTFLLHPLLLGALVGVSAHGFISIPDFMGDSRLSATIWLASAGVFSYPIHAKLWEKIETW